MTRKLIVLFWITVLCLSSCNYPLPSKGSPSAWIDDPLDGMHLPLQPYTLTLHSSDPLGISQMEVSINGQVLATLPNPDPAHLLVYLTQKWEPSAPGRYLIRARAQNTTGAWGAEDLAIVEIGGTITPTTTLTPTPTPTTFTTTPTITDTPTPTLTRTPTLTQTVNLTSTPTRTPSPTLIPVSGTVSFRILRISNNPFYFRLPDQRCSLPRTTTIRVRLDSTLPISSVSLMYGWKNLSGRATRITWQTMAMNSGGGNDFEATINSDTDLTLPKVAASGILELQFLAVDSNNTSTRSQVYTDLTLSSCP